MELIGLYLIGCALVVIAGVMKMMRPDDTTRALLPLLPRRLRSVVDFRRLRGVVRVASFCEAGLGMTSLVVPRPVLAAMLAASFLVFGLVVAYARAQGGALASCGCFGTPDTPATILHIALDVVLAIAAGVFAFGAPTAGSILTVLSSQPVHGTAMVLAVAVGTWLTYLVLSVLSVLHGVRLAAGPLGKRS